MGFINRGHLYVVLEFQQLLYVVRVGTPHEKKKKPSQVHSTNLQTTTIWSKDASYVAFISANWAVGVCNISEFQQLLCVVLEFVSDAF